MKRNILIVTALACFAMALGQAQTAQESLQTLTERTRALRRGGWRTEEFSRAITARSEAFRQLIRTDPRGAVDSALPQDAAARMRQWSADVESTGAWNGSMETRMEDDPVTGSRRRYYLRTAAEELEVFPAEAPPDLSCEQDVAVEGVRLGSDVAAKAIVVLAATVGCSTTGVQNVAVILINFSNSTLPTGLTQSFVSNA
jgi:hypothetical protein